MPSFDGLAAMKIAREKCPHVPFIFVSGALGEEMAIDLLKKGATDYVLKNRLSRLEPAVSRALHEVEERTERERAEHALTESEVRYRTILENTGTATVIVDEDATIVLANRQFERLTGFSRSEIEGKKKWTEFVFEDDLPKVKVLTRAGGKHSRTPSDGYEFRITNNRNGVLNVLLKHREEDKATLEEQVLANVKKLVLPYLEKLKGPRLDSSQRVHIEIIDAHLNDIASPFLRNLSSAYLSLTPREIEVATLVKEGKTTKEITRLLNISTTAVDFHRKNLRSKFGIKSKKTNLRSFFTSLYS
jgi:PAS domain S-box-containing protein